MSDTIQSLDQLLDRNRAWASERRTADAQFFERQVATHTPRFLWIGCSDARVPANVLTGTQAGEMFVHRNIANTVSPTDGNLAAVLQYAIEALGVQDVIVCGHGGCGGVKAAMGELNGLPLVDAWLDRARTTLRLHADELDAIGDDDARYRRLIELHAEEQVATLATLPVVREAWARGATLRLHGMVYEIADGTLRDLGVTRSGPQASSAAPAMAGRA